MIASSAVKLHPVQDSGRCNAIPRGSEVTDLDMGHGPMAVLEKLVAKFPTSAGWLNSCIVDWPSWRWWRYCLVYKDQGSPRRHRRELKCWRNGGKQR